MTYIIAGNRREFRDYLAARSREVTPCDAVWVEGVHTLAEAREPDVILTGSYKMRIDWQEIEGELRARKASVRVAGC